jgi:RHS repeat-associated protein
LDEHTGFYYYRARWYDPRTGSFISADPIGFEGRDLNFYRYVKNNSLKYTDPSGLLFPGPSFVLNPYYSVVPMEILPKKNKSYDKPSFSQKLLHLLSKKTTPKTEEKTSQDFLDNVLDDKKNEYSDLNCPLA